MSWPKEPGHDFNGQEREYYLKAPPRSYQNPRKGDLRDTTATALHETIFTS